MLKNIPDCISPELLKALAEMGHGDEIVFGDGNFPAHSNCSRVIRADGHSVTELIDAVLKLMPLDTMMEDYAFVMATADGSTPPIWTDYQAVIRRYGYEPKLKQVERFGHQRARPVRQSDPEKGRLLSKCPKTSTESGECDENCYYCGKSRMGAAAKPGYRPGKRGVFLLQRQ